MQIFLFRARRPNGTGVRDFVMAETQVEALATLAARFPNLTGVQLELAREMTDGEQLQVILMQVRDLRQDVKAIKAQLGISTAGGRGAP